MHKTPQASRRKFLKYAAAISSAPLLAPVVWAQGAAPRVVVVGGGFAGASCARALRRADERIAVTLVESNANYIACPFSNEVIAGMRELNAQQFSYDKVAAHGITLVRASASAIDAEARSVILADGRLIVLGEGGKLGLFTVNPREPEEICSWQAPQLHYPCWAGPVLAQGRLYLRREDRLLCFDLRAR